MPKNSIISIDEIEITPQLIQRAFKDAEPSRTRDVLSETFRLLDLAQASQNSPADTSLKLAIKSIVNSKLLPEKEEPRQEPPALDPSESYPLNKNGSFGSLERTCKLIEVGLMEYETGKKEGKPKKIGKVLCHVERLNDKGNNQDIAWITDSKTFQFRIILIGENQKPKAIYFPNKQKAESVLAYLIDRHNCRGGTKQIFSRLNSIFQNGIVTKLADKIVFKSKIDKKSASVRQSLSSNQIVSATNKNASSQQISIFPFSPELTNSLIARPSKTQTLQGYDGNLINDLVSTHEQQRRLSLNKTNSPNQLTIFLKNQEEYKKALLLLWLDKARAKHKSIQQQKANQRNALLSNVLLGRFKEERGSRIVSQERTPNKGESEANQSRNQSRNQSGNQSVISKKNQKEAPTKQFCQFLSVQFLKRENNLLFKPILTIQLLKDNRIIKSVLYNTLLKRKDPCLLYSLINEDESEIEVAEGTLKQYTLNIRVVDFLLNEEVLSDTVNLSSKLFNQKTFLLTEKRELRLEMRFRSNLSPVDSRLDMASLLVGNVLSGKSLSELQLPPLHQANKEKIKAYWQRESQSRGYYNEGNLSTYEILIQSQQYPLTWWLNLSDNQYTVLNIINTASLILGFKMVGTMRHIIKVFMELYSELAELTEAILSMISTYLRTHYYPEQLTKPQKFHHLLGLEEQLDLASKAHIEMETIDRILRFQCPILSSKFKRKNISIKHQLYEYVYELFARNYQTAAIVQIWNYLFMDIECLQLHLALLAVVIVKVNEDQLSKCKRLSEVREVLESKTVTNTQRVIKEVITLREKYFGESKGILDEIKKIFINRPLEDVLVEFYRRETARIDERKESKETQKKSVLKKVNKLIGIDLPEYPPRKYCLHVYFSILPEIDGSMYLKCDETEYECLRRDNNNKYFIISEISTEVTLEFIDNKSNSFTCLMQFSYGVNQFTSFLHSSSSSKTYKVVYLSGLLTDYQIEVFQKGKKYEHFITPFLKKNELFEEMTRGVAEVQFLRKYDNNSHKEDLVKKCKVLFSMGSKSFNEIEFYLRRIEASNSSFQEKLELVKAFATSLSEEYFLCQNKILEKHFLLRFLEIAHFPLQNAEFECYYKDSLQYEFQAPKIVKCRFISKKDPSREIKLEAQAYEYLNNKTHTSLYSDTIVEDLIQYLKPAIQEQNGVLADGDIRLLYSNNGEIHQKYFSVKVKNKSKDIVVDERAQKDLLEIEEINEPEVLMTEILPSFTKITTILDYVNTSRNVDLKSKYANIDKRKVAEPINILKLCRDKLRSVLQMRYIEYPKYVTVPFLHYYFDLMYDTNKPPVVPIYLNGSKCTIRQICTCKGTLRFSENSKVEAFTFQEQLGLYGNMRKIAPDSKGAYFFSNSKDQDNAKQNQAKLFMNYGYGIFRWEPCVVRGFIFRAKVRKGKIKPDEDTEPKKIYFVTHQNEEKQLRSYELKIKKAVQDRLYELDIKKTTLKSVRKGEQNIALSFLSKFMT